MTKPYKYQKEGVRLIEGFGGRALLADEMGLGKSFQALLYALKTESWPLVIVCPASIKWNWEAEVAKHLGLPAVVLGSTTPPKRMNGMTRSKIYVINYDVLSHWVSHLKKLRPKLLVGDEAHYVCNSRVKRSRAFRELSDGIRKLILITGTPMVNSPKDLWHLLHLIRPAEFPYFLPFARKYTKVTYKPWGVTFEGGRNLKRLHRILTRTCMVRRLKKDVLDQLPPKQTVVVPVQIDNRKEYDAAEKDFAAWLRKTYPKRASKARKAERLVRFGYLRRLVGVLKLKPAQDWIDDYLRNTDGRLLAFAVHKKAVVREMHDRYAKVSTFVDGSVVGRERQNRFDAFGAGRFKVLFGNVRAAGVGWSASGCDTAVFLEYPWTPAEFVQAGDRIHGVGRGVRGRASTVYCLVAKDTVEERLVRILQDKARVAAAALDGDEAAARQAAVFDLLEQELLKGRGLT